MGNVYTIKRGFEKMKKIGVLFLMLFFLVGALNFVVAEDDSEEVEIPEAKKVGFFGNAADRVRLAFTFNKERKIDFVLKMAEKRLAEAEAVAEENPERAERAQERYDELIAKSEEILANIEEGENSENRSVEQISKVARIQNKFERHREHAEEIYARALERFEANNASDEKIERFESFYERSLNRSYEMEEKALEKRRNIVEKRQALTGESDEELEEVLEGIEEEEGLTEGRENRERRKEVRAEKFEEVRRRFAEKNQARLDESDLTEEQKEEIRKRMELRDQRTEEFRRRAERRAEEVEEVSE